MQIYEANLAPPRQTLWIKAVVAISCAALFFCLRFGWSLIRPPDDELNMSLASRAIDTAIMSLIWGTLMAFLPRRWLGMSGNWQVAVDEDSIASSIVHGDTPNFLKSKNMVHKGKIRSIFEVRGWRGNLKGIGISERSELVAKMTAFVFVPAALDEFDDVRLLAESWKAPGLDR